MKAQGRGGGQEGHDEKLWDLGRRELGDPAHLPWCLFLPDHRG